MATWSFVLLDFLNGQRDLVQACIESIIFSEIKCK